MPRPSGQPVGMLPDDLAGFGKADHPGWSGVVQNRAPERRDAGERQRPLSTGLVLLGVVLGVHLLTDLRQNRFSLPRHGPVGS